MRKGDRIVVRKSGIQGTILAKLYMLSYYRVYLDTGRMTYVHISDMSKV